MMAMTAGLLVTACSTGSDQMGTSEAYDASGPASLAEPAATQAAPAPEAPAEDSTVSTTDIVVTGSISMTVDDPSAAADKFAEATTAAGGRVESRAEYTNTGYPSASLTLRIPTDEVDAVLADVDDLGVVNSKNISTDDVTAQRVDLDARIEALQTSVDRLLELMSRAANTEDLLAAESQLTQRQAELDSLNAQRTALGDQIAYATISVDLSSTPPVIAQGGFLGAIEDGWNALVNFGGGLARMVGFLLPWIPVFLLIGVGVVFLRRTWRRRPRKPKQSPPAPPQPQLAHAGPVPAGPPAAPAAPGPPPQQ